MNTKDDWDALHKDPRFMPMYPDDRAVAWVFRNFPRAKSKGYRLLDLGCGAGRHSLFLAENGYRAYAADFSDVALQELRRRAAAASLKIDAVACDATALRFPDRSFDGILCIGVLYYLPYAKFRDAVSEMHRVMKKGAKAMVVVRSVEDGRCRNALEIAPHTYRLRKLPATVPSDAKEGNIMTFLDKAGIRATFGRCFDFELNKVTVEESSGRFANVDWQLLLTR